MSKNKLILYCFFIWIVSLGVSNFYVLANTGAAQQTIIGEVTAVDWDDQGNVIEVAISVMLYPQDSTQLAYTEDYLVGQNETGKKLLTRVNSRVEATGKIVIAADGYKTIFVESFEVIQEDYYQEESYFEPPLRQN